MRFYNARVIANYLADKLRVHAVNIVTLDDDTKWMIDVGFGGDGPTSPLPLTDGTIVRNLGTQEVRLIRDLIDDQTERMPYNKLWIYQYRNHPLHAWNSFYAFSDTLEFFPSDLGIINWYTSTHPENIQTSTVLVILFLRRSCLSDDKRQEIYAKRMLVNGVVKEFRGEKTTVIQTCHSEAERVNALKVHFNIELTDEQRTGIKGYRTEITSN